MAGKVFKQAENVDPIFFEVEVKAKNGNPERKIRFDCNDDIPGGVMFAFAGEDEQAAVANGEPTMNMVTAAKDLFNAAVVEEQQELFWAMVNGKKDAPGMIGLTMMMGIAEYISESYSARPTGASSDAGSPRTSNGSASRVGAPAGELTYSRSQPSGPSIL